MHMPHRTTTDRVLLLDTFFNVVVFLGDNINKWVQVRRFVLHATPGCSHSLMVTFPFTSRFDWSCIALQNGVHLNPEYAYFAEFLKAPQNDANAIMQSRFPFPKYVYVRTLLSVLQHSGCRVESSVTRLFSY